MLVFGAQVGHAIANGVDEDSLAGNDGAKDRLDDIYVSHRTLAARRAARENRKKG